jgi:hypothetical protein
VQINWKGRWVDAKVLHVLDNGEYLVCLIGLVAAFAFADS